MPLAAMVATVAVAVGFRREDRSQASEVKDAAMEMAVKAVVGASCHPWTVASHQTVETVAGGFRERL